MLEDTNNTASRLQALGCTQAQVEHHLKHLTAIAHQRAAKLTKGTKGHRTSPPRNYGPRGKPVELTAQHIKDFLAVLVTEPHRWRRPESQEAHAWAGDALAKAISPHKASINGLTGLLIELRDAGVVNVLPKPTNKSPGFVIPIVKEANPIVKEESPIVPERRTRIRLNGAGSHTKPRERGTHGDIESFAGWSASESSQPCAANVSGFQQQPQQHGPASESN